MINRHQAEVEADLQQFYGVNYRQRGTKDLPTARLLVLVDQLPLYGSRFWAAVHNQDPVDPVAIIASDIYAALGDGTPHWVMRRKELLAEKTKQTKRAKAAKRMARARRAWARYKAQMKG